MRIEGIILVDVLLAMSLAAFFVAIFSSAFYSVEHSFERAHERMSALVTGDTEPTSPSLPIYVPVSNMPICSTDFTGSTSTLLLAPSPMVKIIHLPISSTIPLTHLEVRKDMAFISGDSSIASDPDLFVVDIGGSWQTGIVSSEAPTSSLVSSIDTGPGISSFALVGKRIFASAASAAAQLHVVSFIGTSSPTQPLIEDKYKLPLPYATATPPYATAISFELDKSVAEIYLGTEKWDGDEFSTIDVSRPSSPVWRSGLDIDSKVNDITVASGTAYISNANQNQLIQADANTWVGFSPSGWLRQEGEVASLYNGRIVFGRTSGGYDISTDHELFSWATTTTIVANNAPSISGNFSSKNIPGGVYGIVQDQKLIYVITHQTGKEFQVLDTTLSTSMAFSLPSQPKSMTCDGDTIYVLSRTSSDIYAITFHD